MKQDIWNRLVSGLGYVSPDHSVSTIPAQEIETRPGKFSTMKHKYYVKPGSLVKVGEINASEYILDFANPVFGGGVLTNGWVQEEQLVFCTNLMVPGVIQDVRRQAPDLSAQPALITCNGLMKINGASLEPYMSGYRGWNAITDLYRMNRLSEAFTVYNTAHPTKFLAAAAPDVSKKVVTEKDYEGWFKTCTAAFSLLPKDSVVHTGVWGAGAFGHDPLASVMLQLRAAGKVIRPPSLVFHVPDHAVASRIQTCLDSQFGSVQRIPAKKFNAMLVDLTQKKITCPSQSAAVKQPPAAVQPLAAVQQPPAAVQPPVGGNCSYMKFEKSIRGVQRVLMLYDNGSYILPGGPHGGGRRELIKLLDSQLGVKGVRYNLDSPDDANGCFVYTTRNLPDSFFSGGTEVKKGRVVLYIDAGWIKYKWVPLNDYAKGDGISVVYGGGNTRSSLWPWVGVGSALVAASAFVR